MKTTNNLGKTFDLISTWIRSDGQTPSRNLKIYVGEDNQGYAEGDLLDANYVIGMLNDVVTTGNIQGNVISSMQTSIALLKDNCDDLADEVDRIYDDLILRLEQTKTDVNNKIEELKQVLTWESV